MSAPASASAQRRITDQIIETLERSVKPWRNGWVGQGGGGFPLRGAGEAYRGMSYRKP